MNGVCHQKNIGFDWEELTGTPGVGLNGDLICYDELYKLEKGNISIGNIVERELPGLGEVLNLWVQKDFGTYKNMLNVLGFSENDFSVFFRAGIKNQIMPENPGFHSILNDECGIGINLARYLTRVIPDDIFTPFECYIDKRVGEKEVTGIRALNYFNDIKTGYKRPYIDISDETLEERLKFFLENRTRIQSRTNASYGEVSEYRIMLDERITELSETEISDGRGKSVKISREELTRRISAAAGIDTWELYAFVPIERKLYNRKFGKTGNSRLEYIDTGEIVSDLADILYAGPEDCEKRERFFDAASEVLNKNVPFNIEEAMICGLEIDFNLVVQHMRRYLKHNEAVVSKSREKPAVKITLENKDINYDEKETTRFFRNVSFNPIITEKFKELYDRHKLEQRSEKALEKINGNSLYSETFGGTLKKIRHERLRLSMKDTAETLGIDINKIKRWETNRRVMKEDELKEFARTFCLPENDPYYAVLKTAIENVTRKKRGRKLNSPHP